MASAIYTILALAASLHLAQALEPMTADDMAKVKRAAYIHGVLGALSCVIFFPAGAVILRLLKGRAAVFVHAVWQVFSYAVYTSSVGLGIWLAMRFDRLGGYHPILGLIVFCAASFQLVGGVAAHLKFKKTRKPTVEGRAHGYSGILLITLGMVDGGLGLLYSKPAPSTGVAVAYGIVTAVVWICFVVFVMVRKRQGSLSAPEEKKGLGIKA